MNQTTQQQPTETQADGLFPAGHGSYRGIYKPEYNQYIYNKNYTCPQCKKTFTGKKIFRSKLISNKPTRFDLRKYYVGYNSAWYDILTCPHCWFSMFAEYFTEPKVMNRQQLSEKLGALQGQVQLNLEAERDLETVFAQHYIALACADSMWDSDNLRLKLWSNLSWLYEDEGNTDLERLACHNAAEAGKHMYSETRLTPLQEQLTCLAVAGMMYRCGEDDGLRQWLFQAKTMKGGKKAYADLADNLLSEIKDDKAGE